MLGGKNLDGKPKITMLDVWEGRAHQTAGGLKKPDLMLNKKNKVVSRRKHELGIRNFTGFRAKLCDGDFDLSKFKPTYSAKYMPKKKKAAKSEITEVKKPMTDDEIKSDVKERVQKMLSVRRTDSEMADTIKRLRAMIKKNKQKRKADQKKISK